MIVVKEGDHYPRVLIIVKSQINDIDSTGMSLRNWFHDWPSQNLAQIYSGVAGKEAGLIGSSFQLGVSERVFGQIFFRLKKTSLSHVSTAYAHSKLKEMKQIGLVSKLISSLLRKIGELVINTGLWELIFRPKLSSSLNAWISAFKPDVLFVQGCDISFMQLPLLIAKEFDVPVCFDVVDDWVEHLYKGTLLSPFIVPIVRRNFRELAANSSLCYAIGPSMVQEYKFRYGVNFKTLMQCADQGRYASGPTREDTAWNTINIVYSGSLALERWKGILELSRAAEILSQKDLNVVINVYAPFIPSDASALATAFSVRLHNALPDQEVPALLSSADILFLPESFDKDISSYIRLSISTKAHLYMMSGRVSLVYGPSEIGTVDYARKCGWGYVVDEQKVDALVDAVEQIAQSPGLRHSLTENAKLTVQANHSDRAVREQLRNDLLSIAKGRNS